MEKKQKRKARRERSLSAPQVHEDELSDDEIEQMRKEYALLKKLKKVGALPSCQLTDRKDQGKLSEKQLGEMLGEDPASL
eukprot:312273-Hanusia_phi.AAC.6